LQQKLVSIVVTNFNYARFLRVAIDSALAQTYRLIEVIVVDDGSTDGSRGIIASYGERVRPIFKANGGHISAQNAGYLATSGDVVLFLDADDALQPTAIERAVAAMAPGVSAVQMPVMTIDEDGRPLGSVLPVLPKRWGPAEIRRTVRRTGFYPYPPTSGNAYARWFIARIMPVDPARVHAGLDGVLNGTAALHGDVIVLRDPLAYYRFHGSNAGAAFRLRPERLNYYVSLDIPRNAFLVEEAKRLGIALKPGICERAFYYAQYRLASLKLRPDLHPIADDTLRSVTQRFLEAAFLAPDPPFRRVLFAIWGLAVALARVSLATQLVELRFCSGARPKVLETVFRAFGLVRRTQQRSAAARTADPQA